MKIDKQLFIKLFLLNLIAVLTISSCSKERIEPKEEKEQYESADEYLDSKKSAEQEYEITEEGEGPLKCTEGTKIWLSKDILMYPNGDSVHFPYTIRVVELYTTAQMVYHQVASMAGNTLLRTHGEIRVRAFKEDVELVLRPEKYWVVEMPNANPKQNMLCYYGSNSDSKVDWTDLHSTTFDSISSGYHGNIVEMGWVSCAQDAIGTMQTSICTFYSDSLSLQGLNSFIYLPEQEGLMPVLGGDSAPLPVGEEMKIIMMGKQAEQNYSFYKEDIVDEINSIEVILEPTSESELTSKIEGL